MSPSQADSDDLTSDAGLLAGLQLRQRLGAWQAFVANGTNVQEIKCGLDSLGGKRRATGRPDTAHEPHRRVQL
jgi:hypothetical protein